MDENITIIEGPPPTFESVSDGWVMGLNEGPNLADIAITRLRTFNGPALVERCYRAWNEQKPIFLEFRASDGLEDKAPIVAARALDIDEGQMLVLWVRLNNDEVELELGYSDEFGDDFGDDFGDEFGDEFDDDIGDDFDIDDLTEDDIGDDIGDDIDDDDYDEAGSLGLTN